MIVFFPKIVRGQGCGTLGRGYGLGNNEADLTALVANLQRQLEAQERELQQFRGQQNNLNANGEGNGQANPPIQPQCQQAPFRQLANQEPLYVRFKRMKPPEFDGSTDPLIADG